MSSNSVAGSGRQFAEAIGETCDAKWLYPSAPLSRQSSRLVDRRRRILIYLSVSPMLPSVLPLVRLDGQQSRLSVPREGPAQWSTCRPAGRMELFDIFENAPAERPLCSGVQFKRLPS